MVAFFMTNFGHVALAETTYSEFSKTILKTEVYNEYRKEADAGDIAAIVEKVSNKPYISDGQYVEIAQRVLKPEVYERLEKKSYEEYDKIKPLPKINENGIEVIDIQRVRAISKTNNEITAFRQAYIAGAIELEKHQFITWNKGSNI